MPSTNQSAFTATAFQPETSPLEINPPSIAAPLSVDPLVLLSSSSSSLPTPDGLAQGNFSFSEITSGYFTVDRTGQVQVDYLFDGGSYEGELAIFSLSGLDAFTTNLSTLTTEIVRRALSDTTEGHVVIRDAIEGARFDGELGEANFNAGTPYGVKTFTMTAGDRFGVMMTPNGTIAALQTNPNPQGRDRPLFSLVGLNPEFGFQVGQMADVDGRGSTFVLEDLRVDGESDRDYNDIIFQVRNAIGTAVSLADVIPSDKDWRELALGQALLDYADAYDNPRLPQPIRYDFPLANQPLIGIIDTGFSGNNPDIDYNRITLGRDRIDNDADPLLAPGTGNDHGTHVIGIIAAKQDNGIGIDGINDKAPLWVGREIGSGKLAESLTEFVDAAKKSKQPHAVINLSLDLTQKDAKGNVSTRYEFTPAERKAIEYARQNGVLIVAAAGNEAGVMSVLGQASQEFDNIITVGAANGRDRAEYSSYGAGLDILAPGGVTSDPVLSTVGQGVGPMSGTSVATAQVTGAISQVWAANPGLSYRQVIDLVKQTATDLKTPGWDVETGAGLLNLEEAVEAAKTTTPEPYKPEPLFVPDSWRGEGTAIADEQAVATAVIRPRETVWSRAIGDEQTKVGNLLGWNRGYPTYLGRPTIYYLDTVSPTGLTGKLSIYEAIYWSSRYKAVALWGEILREYTEMGGPSSWLGHPVKREYDWKGGKRTDFEGGYIFWDGKVSQALKPYEMPGTPITPTPPTIPTPPTTPAPFKPGEGRVPVSAGGFLGTVNSSSGVVMHYYQNGYLVVQPGGREYWYTVGNGVAFDPTKRPVNKPTPIVDPIAADIILKSTSFFPDPNRDATFKGGSYSNSLSGKVGGSSEQSNYYKFSLSEPRSVKVQLTGLAGDANVKLYNPYTKTFYSMYRSGSTSEEFERLLPSGDYYLVVEPGVSTRATKTEASYTLTTTVETIDRRRFTGIQSGITYVLEKGELRQFMEPSRNVTNHARRVPDSDLELFEIGNPLTRKERDGQAMESQINLVYNSDRGLLGNYRGGPSPATKSTYGTTGYWSSYDNGTVHWSTKYGAVPVWHEIQRVYDQMGGSGGGLGFPTRREYDSNGGRRTDFEGGFIFWTPQLGARAYKPGETPILTPPYTPTPITPNPNPGSDNPITNPDGFTAVSFSHTVGVDTAAGIRLRTDTFINAPFEGVTHDSSFEFDGWKYGEPVSDRTVADGRMDALWYRIKGTNHWIPSAFINGYPPNNPPTLPGGSVPIADPGGSGGDPITTPGGSGGGSPINNPGDLGGGGGNINNPIVVQPSKIPNAINYIWSEIDKNRSSVAANEIARANATYADSLRTAIDAQNRALE